MFHLFASTRLFPHAMTVVGAETCGWLNPSYAGIEADTTGARTGTRTPKPQPGQPS